MVDCDGFQGEELPEILQGAGYQVVVNSNAQSGLNFELTEMQLAVLTFSRVQDRKSVV